MENPPNSQECQTDRELEQALQQKLQALSLNIVSIARNTYQLDLDTVDLFISSDDTYGIKFVLKPALVKTN